MANGSSSMARVSVGLPVYNGENFIQEALDSLLAQTFQDIEIIISDNASTDRTQEICLSYAARDPRIRYHRQNKNLGAIANYNFVYEQSAGEYFKWAAHDDLIAPTFLERCAEALDQNPEVALCSPQISYIDANGKVLRRARRNLGIRAANPADRLRDFVRLQTQGTDIFWTIFGLIRRRALAATGLFDNFVASDRVLLMKLLLVGQLHEVAEPLFFRREHVQASTVKLPKMRKYRASAQWYSVNNTARLVLPNWRLSVEYLSALKIRPLSWLTRIRCYGLIAKLSALRWKKLALELATVPSQILGAR